MLFFTFSCQKDNPELNYEPCVATILETTDYLPYEGNVDESNIYQSVLSAYSFKGAVYFQADNPLAYLSLSWYPVLNCDGVPIAPAGDSIYQEFKDHATLLAHIGVFP